MCTTSSFRSIENKHDVYRRRDYVKRFYEFLRKPTMKMINFEKRKNEIIQKRIAEII